MFRHPIIKVSLLFGLACGVVAFTFFLFLYWKGTDALSNGRLLIDCLSALFFVVAAIWYFRRVVRGGWLHFWEALSVGFLTNLVAALVSTVCIYLFITLVQPNVLSGHIQALEDMLVLRKPQYIALAGEAVYKQQLADLQKISATDIFWDEIGKKELIGLVIVLIVSILLRKQPYSFINPGGPEEKSARVK